MSGCHADEVRAEAFAYYPQLDRLAAYCNENYTEDISLVRAAEIAALERTYFCTFFHNKVGVCFICWLGLLRVAKAKEKIRHSNGSLTSIAHDVGFGSIGTFQRTFKRSTGMTASAYRKQVRPC